MDSPDTLDVSKENIQPLRQGRNAAQLTVALQAQSDSARQQDIYKEREAYELSLRTYDGDDPLQNWYLYIEWVEQSFPKHGKEGNLSTLLYNCLTQFKDSEKYFQDLRLLKIWIKYIGMVDNPLEIYSQLYAHGIGTQCALFYRSWAEELFECDDIKHADKVFKEGLRRKAEPVSELQQAHENFQIAVARRVLDTSVTTNDDTPDVRKVGNVLTSFGRKHKVPSVRVGSNVKSLLPGKSVQKENVPRNKTHPVKVFEAENDPNLTNSTSKLQNIPSVEVLRKENNRKPVPWSAVTLRTKISSASAAKPPFKVHGDDIVSASPCPNSGIILSALQVKKTNDEFHCPIAVPDPPDPKKRPMYPKDKVYTGGTEFSLEELRAVKYRKSKTCKGEANLVQLGKKEYTDVLNMSGVLHIQSSCNEDHVSSDNIINQLEFKTNQCSLDKNPSNFNTADLNTLEQSKTNSSEVNRIADTPAMCLAGNFNKEEDSLRRELPASTLVDRCLPKNTANPMCQENSNKNAQNEAVLGSICEAISHCSLPSFPVYHNQHEMPLAPEHRGVYSETASGNLASPSKPPAVNLLERETGCSYGGKGSTNLNKVESVPVTSIFFAEGSPANNTERHNGGSERKTISEEREMVPVSVEKKKPTFTLFVDDELSGVDTNKVTILPHSDSNIASSAAPALVKEDNIILHPTVLSTQKKYTHGSNQCVSTSKKTHGPAFPLYVDDDDDAVCLNSGPVSTRQTCTTKRELFDQKPSMDDFDVSSYTSSKENAQQVLAERPHSSKKVNPFSTTIFTPSVLKIKSKTTECDKKANLPIVNPQSDGDKESSPRKVAPELDSTAHSFITANTEEALKVINECWITPRHAKSSIVSENNVKDKPSFLHNEKMLFHTNHSPKKSSNDDAQIFKSMLTKAEMKLSTLLVNNGCEQINRNPFQGDNFSQMSFVAGPNTHNRWSRTPLEDDVDFNDTCCTMMFDKVLLSSTPNRKVEQDISVLLQQGNEDTGQEMAQSSKSQTVGIDPKSAVDVLSTIMESSKEYRSTSTSGASCSSAANQPMANSLVHHVETLAPISELGAVCELSEAKKGKNSYFL